MAEAPHFRHLIRSNAGEGSGFVSPRSGRDKFSFPNRNRNAHFAKIKRQLDEIKERLELEGKEKEGIRGTFESAPGFDLRLESLERKGIELLQSQHKKNKQGLLYTQAMVHIEPGHLSAFLKLAEAYRSEQSEKGHPKNEKLIASIEEIRLSVLEDFWIEPIPFPGPGEVHWWEIWTRRDLTDRQLAAIAANTGIEVSKRSLQFPERTIRIIKGTREQISVDALLDWIAEIRRPPISAEFIVRLGPIAQAQWEDSVLKRLLVDKNSNVSVCLLDTGVFRGHRLLDILLASEDMHALDDQGSHDSHGHGTQMAGLVAFGDLSETIGSNGPIGLPYRLESVKLINENRPHEPDVYGAVTKEAVARAEIQAPHRKRVVNLAVTAKFNDEDSSKEYGLPSSWSAAIDQLCSGSEEQDLPQRLVLVSAGNIGNQNFSPYPDQNLASPIEDPGQAWNALTIGACTFKQNIDLEKDPDIEPLAPSGGLSPFTRTGTLFDKSAHLNKPDLVFEGGNTARNSVTGDSELPDSLALLTTNNLRQLPFTVTSETSAATALASRLAATILSEYPDLWPETVRGLMVHSARWTDAMRKEFLSQNQNKDSYRKMIRACGHGFPDQERALWTLKNAVTLIHQDSLRPFQRIGGKIKTGEMKYHHLPWPTKALSELAEVEVRLRVTLSYYIEPNPGQRGSIPKYLYASHRLRFELKRANESPELFQKRINKAAEQVEGESATDSPEWDLGYETRNQGSLHSDVWRGSAADLATRDMIGVFPGGGWWKKRPSHARYDRIARYSLIVSIETEKQDVDFYTPIATELSVPIDA